MSCSIGQGNTSADFELSKNAPRYSNYSLLVQVLLISSGFMVHSFVTSTFSAFEFWVLI